LIDWLTSCNPFSIFGYFQFPNLKEVQQSKFPGTKIWAQTDLLLQSPEAFWLVFSCHNMRKTTELQKPELIMQGAWAEERRPIHAKQREFCQHNNYSIQFCNCPCSLQLILQADLKCWAFRVTTSDLQVRWDDVHAIFFLMFKYYWWHPVSQFPL